jgi:rhomboid family GlyGly-CTERM serine protease
MLQHIKNSHLFLPMAISAIMTAILLSGQTGVMNLSYDRASIFNGELWRIFTSHMVHINGSHFTLNIVGLIVVFFLFGHLFRSFYWIMGIVGCMSAISLCQLLFCKELEWYMGFSGVLHGLFVMGVMGEIRRKRSVCCLGLFLIAVKLAAEQFYGPSSGTMDLIKAPIIVNAHFIGAVAGGLFASLFNLSYRNLSEKLNTDGSHRRVLLI